MEVQPYQHEIRFPSPSPSSGDVSQSEIESDASGARDPTLQYQVLTFCPLMTPKSSQLGGELDRTVNLQTMEIPNGEADIQLAPPGPQSSKYELLGNMQFVLDENGTMSVRIINSRRPKV